MTEEEWLACKSPTPMVEHVSGIISERKRRLFAVACCRRFEPLFPDEAIRRVVETLDRFADGKSTIEEVQSGRWAAWQVAQDGWNSQQFAAGDLARLVSTACEAACSRGVQNAWEMMLGSAMIAAWTKCEGVPLQGLVPADSQHAFRLAEVQIAERAAQANILRCMFGSLPFRKVSLVPAWFSSIVRNLAGAIYEERNMGIMPILADALEDAGCTNADILSHCRQPGEHVRGCWVIDLLLGKE